MDKEKRKILNTMLKFFEEKGYKKEEIEEIEELVEEKEKNFLNLNLKEAGKLPLPYEPTHRFDIYKNRRGQYKNISIWSYINLGTGERHDLYITTMSGKIIKEFEVSSSTYWEEEIKFG